tara:strand:- start:190 stop:576 length:387 start_codon:yes stop_codon:yes gene_type:complete
MSESEPAVETWHVIELKKQLRSKKEELRLVPTLTCSKGAKKNKRRGIKKAIKRLEEQISAGRIAHHDLVKSLDEDWGALRTSLSRDGELGTKCSGLIRLMQAELDHRLAGMTHEERQNALDEAHRMFG